MRAMNHQNRVTGDVKIPCGDGRYSNLEEVLYVRLTAEDTERAVIEADIIGKERQQAVDPGRILASMA
jgi:hypothetical protein